MRKKIVALMLGVVVALSVTACGGNADKDKKADSSAAVGEETPETTDDSSSGESDAEAADDSSAEADAGEAADDSSSEEAADDSSSDAEADGDSQEVAEGEMSEDMWNVIEQLSLIEPTDALVGTEWSLSGGMVDGVEMDQAALDDSLEMYSGKLDVVFKDGENISMVQGGGTLEGTYWAMPQEKRLLGIVFDNDGSELKYAGLLADVDGEQVLMLFSDDTGRNAVYFTQK